MGHAIIPISVVIPTYNRSRLIRRAITCVLAQTVPCKELLVVDDGSTDDTVDVVRGFGPPVRLIPQQHGGPSRARNLGVAEATTEWIAFLDSDDLWHPDYLERMARAIARTNGEAAIYFTDVEYDYGTSRAFHWTKSSYATARDIDLVRDGAAIALMGTHPMLMPFSVFRKDVYLRYGGLWEELWSGEDTHLFTRIALAEPVCAVAGSGGIVTADEGDPGNRLTVAYSSDTVRRWRGQVKMYADLLARAPGLTPAHRCELKRRLAHSYWRVARLSWLEGQRRPAFAALFHSLRADPGVVPAVLRDAALRKFNEAGRSTPAAR